eukprot:Filipodium_phascolosomae@DN327_c0_g1_i1.p1
MRVSPLRIGLEQFATSNLDRKLLPNCCSAEKGSVGSITAAFPGTTCSVSECITAVNLSVVGSGPILMPGYSRSSRYRTNDDFLKRVRMVKVHAILMNNIRGQLPAMFGRSMRQKDLVDNLQSEFQRIVLQHTDISLGDFPEVEALQPLLRNFSFSSIAKLDMKRIQALDETVSRLAPEMIRQIPAEQMAHVDEFLSSNDPNRNPADNVLPSTTTPVMSTLEADTSGSSSSPAQSHLTSRADSLEELRNSTNSSHFGGSSRIDSAADPSFRGGKDYSTRVDSPCKPRGGETSGNQNLEESNISRLNVEEYRQDFDAIR